MPRRRDLMCQTLRFLSEVLYDQIFLGNKERISQNLNKGLDGVNIDIKGIENQKIDPLKIAERLVCFTLLEVKD